MALRSGLPLVLPFAFSGFCGTWLYARGHLGVYAKDHSEHQQKDDPKLVERVLGALPADVRCTLEESQQRLATKSRHLAESLSQVPVRAGELAHEIRTMNPFKFARCIKWTVIRTWNLANAIVDGAYGVTLRIEAVHDAVVEAIEQKTVQRVSREIAAELVADLKMLDGELRVLDSELSDVLSDAAEDVNYCLYNAHLFAEEVTQPAVDWLRAEAQILYWDLIEDTNDLIVEIEESIPSEEETWTAIEELADQVQSDCQAEADKLVDEAYQMATTVLTEVDDALLALPDHLEVAIEEVIQSQEVRERVSWVKKTHDELIDEVDQFVGRVAYFIVDTCLIFGIDLQAIGSFLGEYIGVVAGKYRVAIETVAEEGREIAVDFAAYRPSAEEMLARLKMIAHQNEDIHTRAARMRATVTSMDDAAGQFIKIANERVPTIPGKLQKRRLQVALEFEETFNFIDDVFFNTVDSVVEEVIETVDQFEEEVNQTVDDIEDFFVDTLNDATDTVLSAPKVIDDSARQVVLGVAASARRAGESAKREGRQLADKMKTSTPVIVVTSTTVEAAKLSVKIGKGTARAGDSVIVTVGDAIVKVFATGAREIFAPVLNVLTFALSLPGTLVTSTCEHVLVSLVQPEEETEVLLVLEDSPVPLVIEKTAVLDGDSWLPDWRSEHFLEERQLLQVEDQEEEQLQLEPSIEWNSQLEGSEIEQSLESYKEE